MIIKNMRILNGDSKVKAFFAIEWEGKMTVNDCKLIQGTNGIFAGMPSREYIDKKTSQKKFQSIVYLEQDLLNKVSNAAKVEYERLTGDNQSSAPNGDIPF